MSDKDFIIRRGQAADRILNDEVANQAFNEVISDLQGQWLRSRPDDIQTREGCYRMVHAVQLVVAKLQAYRADAVKETADADARERIAKGGVPSFH